VHRQNQLRRQHSHCVSITGYSTVVWLADGGYDLHPPSRALACGLVAIGRSSAFVHGVDAIGSWVRKMVGHGVVELSERELEWNAGAGFGDNA
jgi:hypothetical protein